EYIFLMTKELKLDPAAGFHAVEILQNSAKPLQPCVHYLKKTSFQRIDNDTAVRFLHSVGHSVSKQALLESELMVLKVLEFRINDPNPLTYVEVLLEVLPSTHNCCVFTLELRPELLLPNIVCLERKAIFDSLLVSTTQKLPNSTLNREKFVAVTEDYMLLGVGVIAVASFIHWLEKWKQIVEELSHITGISSRSISDFARVTLMHIVRDPSSCNHLP
uniref:Cyclin N-terminal domain containing 1 n=1 Tax=Takifugu rubripes TaxID=31033 RepID=A0A674NZA3_TAKRU